MRFVCSLLLLVCGWTGTAQTLHTADELSRLQQFAASNEKLLRFVEDNKQRIYDQSDAYFLMSYNYLQLGDLQMSFAANQQSLNLKNQLHLDNQAENYLRFGAIYLLQGDYQRALENLMHTKDLPIEDPLVYALTDGYIANAYLELQRYQKAEEHFDLALNTLFVELGEDHPDVATTYYNMGRLYMHWGKRDKAKIYFNRALMLYQKIDANAGLLGNIYNGLGTFWRSEDPKKAGEYHQRALRAFQLSYGDYHVETARTHRNLAEAYLLQEQTEQAKAHIQAAIQSLVPAYTSRDWYQLPSAELAVLDRPLLADALEMKARLAVQAGVEADYQLALSASETALELIGMHLLLISGEAARFRLLTLNPLAGEPGIRAGLKLWNATGELAYAERAYLLSEKSRANVLRADEFAIRKLGKLYPEQESKLQALRSELYRAEAQLALEPASPTRWNEVRQIRNAYLQAWRAPQPSDPLLTARGWDDGFVKPAVVQRSLDKETAILSFFSGQDAYYIFAITKDNFRGHELPLDFQQAKTKSNLQKVTKLPNLKKSMGTGVYSKLDVPLRLPTLTEAAEGFRIAVNKVTPQQFIFYGQNLYSKLLYPVEDLWQDKEKLVIIPHAALSYVPFAAIPLKVKDQGKLKYHKVDYLVKDYELVQHYSVTDYLAAPWSQTSGSGYLGMAPVFDVTSTGELLVDVSFRLDSTGQDIRSLASALTADRRSLQALPFSETEVVDIAAAFAQAGQPEKTLIRGEATEAQFEQLAPDYAILHLATHSFTDPAQPALSGIVLAPPAANVPSDGILYAGEIAALSLPADLVVLSSCDSGTGQFLAGEGVLSLNRSFLQAGAQQVLSSLWKVYDQHTHTLMQTFYADILRGKSYAAALRKAQLRMIGSKKTANPLLWSGFMLTGK